MTPGVIHPSIRPAGRPAPPAALAAHSGALALRLSAPLDPDHLREHLAACWQATGGRRRDRSTFTLSVVESCARSRHARERDALRLLALEAANAPACDDRDRLRATLVSLEASEHLLLLSVAPKACTSALLRSLADELARRWPISVVAA